MGGGREDLKGSDEQEITSRWAIAQPALEERLEVQSAQWNGRHAQQRVHPLLG